MLSLATLLFIALQAKGVLSVSFVFGHNALTRTRLDPNVFPGQVSPHVHLFAGGNAVDSTMSVQSMQASTCTTAQISVDKSGYWMPTMYYKHKDGRLSAISGDGFLTYYPFHTAIGVKEELAVIPDDFRMLGGNPTRDFLDMKIPSHQAVSFQCFGKGYDFKHPYLPADRECETIRPQVFFPNCWNGKDAFKADNSHVAYGEGNAEYGPCPAGFVRIPSVFLEAYLKPQDIEGYEWYPGCLVLSNGDNFGLTLHADWANGWPSGLLKEAYDTCPNMKGEFRDCPVLAKFDNAGKTNCRMYGQVVNEPVGLDAPLTKLPGNNPIFNSSREANNPKRPDPNYVERSSVVTYDKANGGACFSQKCVDYHGPRDAPVDTAPPAQPDDGTVTEPEPIETEEPVATPTKDYPGGGGATSTSAAGANETETATETGTVTRPTDATIDPTPTSTSTSTSTTELGGGLNANPQTTAPAEEDGEMICTKRRRPKKGSKNRLPAYA